MRRSDYKERFIADLRTLAANLLEPDLIEFADGLIVDLVSKTDEGALLHDGVLTTFCGLYAYGMAPKGGKSHLTSLFAKLRELLWIELPMDDEGRLSDNDIDRETWAKAKQTLEVVTEYSLVEEIPLGVDLTLTEEERIRNSAVEVARFSLHLCLSGNEIAYFEAESPEGAVFKGSPGDILMEEEPISCILETTEEDIVVFAMNRGLEKGVPVILPPQWVKTKRYR